jgi:uncharacterized membrane protein YvbJ
MPYCPRCGATTKGDGYCQTCAHHFAGVKSFAKAQMKSEDWIDKRRRHGGNRRKKKVTLPTVKGFDK